MFILGQLCGSPGKKLCGFIASIRVKQTLQELIESCFILTVREKLLKNTLIFRPMLEHQWAHNQDVTSSKEMLLSSYTQEKELFLITGDWATPYPDRWCSYRHTKGKRNWLLTNQIQSRLGETVSKLRQANFVWPVFCTKHILSGEKTGMNTAKIFTLLIKYAFAQSIWEMAKI